ncbi:carboxypeptidase D-like isoform X1 [Bolinopsis microptera]|uniref:carboxypeptidase D-like isoform X1 n=1 Tax=Bolinopsis microptera TaxID=2820187 RepID=UPI003078BCF2
MIKDYAKKVPAVMGISFHDGALVTNYPWDGVPDINSGIYAASPDDSLFISMAKTYSLNHKQMYKPSAQCGHDDFKDGITNGNKWYKVYNGMQDWNYFYNDCFEVTIELGCCKYPTDAASTYSNVWSDNFDSILAFSKLANYGIKGRVTDFKGSPMTGVTITVSGVSKTIKVRHPEGYFWRPLLKGTYNISASKPGYYPLSRRNIEVMENESTVVPFILIAKNPSQGHFRDEARKENNTNEQNSSVEDENTEREDENENVEDNESIDKSKNMDGNKDVDENDSVDDSENVDYNDIGDGTGNGSARIGEGPEEKVLEGSLSLLLILQIFLRI